MPKMKQVPTQINGKWKVQLQDDNDNVIETYPQEYASQELAERICQVYNAPLIPPVADEEIIN